MTPTLRAREFQDQGFTVARGFFSRRETTELLAEIERYMPEDDGDDVLTDGGLVFTTNVFKKSEKVRRFISQQRLIDLIRPCAGGDDLWVRWDQAVHKRPGAGVFHWHQDNGYNQVRTEHFQLWIALTESHNENGGLWLAPGSHRRGLLPHARVPGSSQIVVEADVGDSVCVDATAGDVVLFSSLMLHRTGPNDASTTRVAYVAEYMRVRDYDGWLEAPYFMVSEGGASAPRFANRQPGARSLKNQLLYLGPRVHLLVDSMKRPLRALRSMP